MSSPGNFCKLIFRNTGQSYEGYWKEGSQHGIGKMISKDGTFKQGRWENGQNAEWFNSTHTPNNQLNSGFNNANPSPQNTGQNTPNFAQGGNQTQNVNYTNSNNGLNQSNQYPNQGTQASNFNQNQPGNKNASGFGGR